jgi:hypothetical protein
MVVAIQGLFSIRRAIGGGGKRKGEKTSKRSSGMGEIEGGGV